MPCSPLSLSPFFPVQGWKKAVDWVSMGRRSIEYVVVDGLKG